MVRVRRGAEALVGVRVRCGAEVLVRVRVRRGVAGLREANAWSRCWCALREEKGVSVHCLWPREALVGVRARSEAGLREAKAWSESPM